MRKFTRPFPERSRVTLINKDSLSIVISPSIFGDEENIASNGFIAILEAGSS
jgi:hypothetical protein